MTRPDYGVHFRTHFPAGTGIVILMEIPISPESAVADVVEMASIAFKHGARGVWLSTQAIGNDVTDAKEAAAEITKTFTACARGVFRKYGGRWIGLRPRHLPAADQVKFMVKNFPICSGLWVDNLAVEIPNQRHIGTLDYGRAKDVWQLITTNRALGKWDGTFFATIQPKQLKTTFSLDNVIKASVTSKLKENKDAPLTDSDRQKLSMQGLHRLSDAATGVIDAVIVPPQDDVPSKTDAASNADSAATIGHPKTAQITPTVELLAAMQATRPALTTMVPAATLIDRESYYASELPNIYGHIDAVILTHADDISVNEGQFLEHCQALARWIAPKPGILDIFSTESFEAGFNKEDTDGADAGAVSGATSNPKPLLPVLQADVGRQETDSAAVLSGGLISEVDMALREKLEGLLGCRLRVALSDGRLIYGQLLCTDRDRNLVLSNSDEHTRCSPSDDTDPAPAYEFRRHIGLVMVPGAHIVSCATMAGPRISGVI